MFQQFCPRVPLAVVFDTIYINISCSGTKEIEKLHKSDESCIHITVHVCVVILHTLVAK